MAKQTPAEYMREYRKTHRPDPYLHRLRSKRYYDKHLRKNTIGTYPNITKTTKPTMLLKKVVLTHYGGGKLACVKCGESDIDCLSLDHVNNDAHHRSGNGHIGGNNLYRKLVNKNYPIGYQTLCMNCNFKKSLEHLRKNGRSKNIVKDEILPLFKYFEDVALRAKDVSIQWDVRGTTGDGIGDDSELLTSETSDTLPIEITQY